MYVCVQKKFNFFLFGGFFQLMINVECALKSLAHTQCAHEVPERRLSVHFTFLAHIQRSLSIFDWSVKYFI
jgi:hypothetical protein